MISRGRGEALRNPDLLPAPYSCQPDTAWASEEEVRPRCTDQSWRTAHTRIWEGCLGIQEPRELRGGGEAQGRKL